MEWGLCFLLGDAPPPSHMLKVPPAPSSGVSQALATCQALQYPPLSQTRVGQGPALRSWGSSEWHRSAGGGRGQPGWLLLWVCPEDAHIARTMCLMLGEADRAKQQRDQLASYGKKDRKTDRKIHGHMLGGEWKNRYMHEHIYEWRNVAEWTQMMGGGR